eukprot:GHVN01060596.1.p1 GENE.GHVN01060596.1~~GHVN01060596.1.p1  ORF type:complete len:898 (-),score=187.22 GHVN01060596.1:235-2526(-)
MPPLTARSYQQFKKTYLLITSDPSYLGMPMGHHSIELAVHLPEQASAVSERGNWWFATLKLSSGHKITKVYENKRLTHPVPCLWGPWHVETPCSATCNGGVEMLRRTLYAGPSDGTCGVGERERPCNTEECSNDCQVGPWKTSVDCTQRCNAEPGRAYKVEHRQVWMPATGNGAPCEIAFAWNPETLTGWDPLERSVKRLTECDDEFKKPCEEDIGCRVERNNLHSKPLSFPWGKCPMPCGGFGDNTSIVQVAAGIPAWVGRRFFPDVFQLPCQSHRDPIIERSRCNEQPCEDCSIWLEDPAPSKTTIAWVFFVPTQRSDEVTLQAPIGVQFGKRSKNTSEGEESDDNEKKSSEEEARDADGIIEAEDPNYMLMNDEQSHHKCNVERTSFGEVTECLALSVAATGDQRRAKMKLKGVLEAPDKQSHLLHAAGVSTEATRPYWLAIEVRIESVDSMARKVKVEVGPTEEVFESSEWTLTLHGANSYREPETYTCIVKTPIMKAKDCHFVFEAQNYKQCAMCNEGEEYEVQAIRKFEPAANGGVCSILHGERIETVITLPCRHVCPVRRKAYTPSRVLSDEGVALKALVTGVSDILLPSGVETLRDEEAREDAASGKPSETTTSTNTPEPESTTPPRETTTTTGTPEPESTTPSAPGETKEIQNTEDKILGGSTEAKEGDKQPMEAEENESEVKAVHKQKESSGKESKEEGAADDERIMSVANTSEESDTVASSDNENPTTDSVTNTDEDEDEDEGEDEDEENDD